MPGVRPRLATTRSDRPHQWAETGTWGPFRADLALDLEPDHDNGCVVRAEFDVHGLALGSFLTVLARRTVRSDLRRAARLVAEPPA